MVVRCECGSLMRKAVGLGNNSSSLVRIQVVLSGLAGTDIQSSSLAAALQKSSYFSNVNVQCSNTSAGLSDVWSNIPAAIHTRFLRVPTMEYLGLDQQARQLLQEPFPDILISGGRRTAPISLAVREASRRRTFTVQVLRCMSHPPYHADIGHRFYTLGAH